MTQKTGLLIAIEGIDGAGKSTLAQALSAQLTSLQYTVVLTKEPGGTALGKKLREILQNQANPLDPKAEFLLFAADRAQHFHETVIPHLQKGHIVISDRMADSALAYQGYGRGLDLDTLRSINTWAMQGLEPDIVLYIQVPYATARERIIKRNAQLTSFEQEQESFLQKLVVGFDALLSNNPRCIKVDGTQDPDTVACVTVKKIIDSINSGSLILGTHTREIQKS
jgi:dTMP kinase